MVTVAAVAIATLGACSREEAPSAERFCGEIAEHQDELTNPALTTSEEIEPLLDLYRDIAKLAPLAVEADWNHIVSAYETAATVVPGNEASEQAALAAIYSAERSAAAVDRWLRATCAVDLGPIATLVPHD